MANRIISYTRRKFNKEEKEVYKDIDMVSTVNKNKLNVSNDINKSAVFNSIRNIFTWIPGERILMPKFGSKIRNSLYNGFNDYNKETVVSEIQKSILEYEPRVNIVAINDKTEVIDRENNTLKLEIIYTIKNLSNEQYSYLYEYTNIE